ncbi:hypothetical protein [uncultured Magnetospirillum sp.]|uniref:hypothetical protein n=1 Tax=uncultured Magnetospirillum sp. TaxID=354119 RepID=UPI002633BD65|nr:hypothetical protein [uncultured Magnetospirillum sp.]
MAWTAAGLTARWDDKMPAIPHKVWKSTIPKGLSKGVPQARASNKGGARSMIGNLVGWQTKFMSSRPEPRSTDPRDIAGDRN